MAGSGGRWPAGSRRATRASTSRRTGRGGSPTRTATRVRGRASLARRTPTTTACAIPYDADVAGRPRRLSALHGRLQEARRRVRHEGRLGARRPTTARAALAARTGAMPGGDGWTRPHWFERVGEEHRAVRERVGIIDLSSFGKIAVAGPGALALLQRVCANDIDRPIGSTIYTQFLRRAWRDRRRRHRHPRLRRRRFRVVTGSGYLAADLGWLRGARRRRPGDRPGRPSTTSPTTWTVIGLWGPRARDVLAARSPTTPSTTPRCRCARRAVDPRRRARRSTRRGSATPASSAGSSRSSPANAVEVWDALLAAGAAHGIEPFGYRALDVAPPREGLPLLRRRADAARDPVRGRPRARSSASTRATFVGRDALARRAAPPSRTGPSRRLRTRRHRRRRLRCPIYGGEAVRVDGEVVGRLRSAAFGPTVGRTIGTTYLPADARRRRRRSRSTSSTIGIPATVAPRRPRRPGRRTDARLGRRIRHRPGATVRDVDFRMVQRKRNHRARRPATDAHRLGSVDRSPTGVARQPRAASRWPGARRRPRRSGARPLPGQPKCLAGAGPGDR